MREDDAVVTFVCEVKAVTKKAVLVQIDDKECWIPESQIHADSEIYAKSSKKGDKGKIVMSEWIAEQKELA